MKLDLEEKQIAAAFKKLLDCRHLQNTGSCDGSNVIRPFKEPGLHGLHDAM